MTIQQDYVPEEQILALLRQHPDEGLTVRQVADEFDTSYTAAQNGLRQLYMDEEVTHFRPKKFTANKRWRVIDD